MSQATLRAKVQSVIANLSLYRQDRIVLFDVSVVLPDLSMTNITVESVPTCLIYDGPSEYRQRSFPVTYTGGLYRIKVDDYYPIPLPNTPEAGSWESLYTQHTTTLQAAIQPPYFYESGTSRVQVDATQPTRVNMKSTVQPYWAVTTYTIMRLER